MFIEEQDVTAEKIHRVFETAFYSSELMSDDSVKIKLNNRTYYFFITPTAYRISLIYKAFTCIPEGEFATIEHALNTLNAEYAGARFYVELDQEKECTITVDMNFFYEKGLNIYHLVLGLRRLDDIVKLGLAGQIADLWEKWTLLKRNMETGHS